MSKDQQPEVVTRRHFLAGSATAAAAALVAAGAEAAPAKPVAKPAAKPAPAKPAPAKPEVKAEPAKPAGPPPPTVNVAVIGLGPHGRDIIASLGRAPGANLVAVCDTYEAFLRRVAEGAPKAAQSTDYRQVLDRPDVQAVVIATPTHQHREIALAAIQAGKHVYLESPMAHTMEDGRAIARAAKAGKGVFQVGQQSRANPQHHHVHKFVHSAVLGKVSYGRGQWHKRNQMYRPAPSDARQREINWRLDPALSLGLIGEYGIHSLDVSNWMVKELPVSVTGFSAMVGEWEQPRRVADTVQCVLEYPSGVRFSYDATHTNSYDGQFEIFGGSDAAVLIRDQRAWLFKEADAPLLGWEVYARKDEVGDETGIALVADASKQIKEGKIPGKEKQDLDPGKTPLFFSLEAFLNCIRESKKPDCGPEEGYQALVTALKANEAAVTGTRIAYQKEWFSL
ncbi:MAG: putative dehydrogenase [Arthrobacter sp.]|jgi:predicted dehydrogenase|nr:putative dehydrogenase [Arthrobacter sp.]